MKNTTTTTDADKLDNVFKQLKRLKGNETFSEETINNWNKARKYVLNVLPEKEKHSPFNGIGFSPSLSEHLHVIIIGISDLMLCIARQIALIAHYPNFNEDEGSNRTVITILYNSSDLEEGKSKSIIDHISKEEYMCNLTLLCKYTIKKWDGKKEIVIKTENKDSFIDVELELVEVSAYDYKEYMNWRRFTSKDNNDNAHTIVVAEDEVENMVHTDNPDYYETMPIALHNAMRANMVYYVGADIDNLPPDDPNTAERYSRALHYFCYQQSSGDTQKKWNGFFKKDDNGTPTQCVRNQIELRNLLSNIFCTDCFESRLRSVVTIDAINDEFDKSIFSRSKRLFSWRKHRCVEKFYELVEQDENNDADDAKWKEELKKRKKEKGLKGIKEVNRKMFYWFLQYEYRKVLHIVKANLTALAKCEHARWNVEKLILGFSPLTDEERTIDELKFGKAREQYRKGLKKDSKCPKHIDLCSYHDLQRRNPADMKYDCFLMMAIAWILKDNYEQLMITEDEQRNRNIPLPRRKHTAEHEAGE